MIVGFRRKALKRFYDAEDRSKLPTDMIDRIAVLLAAVDQASVVDDLDRPSFKLHGLKGDMKGHWAVTVRANWRITLRFEDGDASDVDFLDYH